MKRKNFRVNQNLDNHVLIDGKPFDIASVKFTRVRPQDVLPIAHLEVTESDFRSNSIIDDMLYQNTDVIGVCPVCIGDITEADDYTSDDNHMYCSEDCYFERPYHICDHCGIPAESPLKTADREYCSIECFKADG